MVGKSVAHYGITAKTGIFTLSQNGLGQAVIVGEPGLASPDMAVDRCTYVASYRTGLGDVKPIAEAGSVVPQEPLSWAKDWAVVRFGGVLSDDVFFTGRKPGFSGLCQINARVPENVVPGNEVPVEVELLGQKSPAIATIAVP